MKDKSTEEQVKDTLIEYIKSARGFFTIVEMPDDSVTTINLVNSHERFKQYMWSLFATHPELIRPIIAALVEIMIDREDIQAMVMEMIEEERDNIPPSIIPYADA